MQEVSFAKSQADVLYDPEKVSVQDMVKALGRYGYRAYSKNGIAESNRNVSATNAKQKNVTLHVDGMASPSSELLVREVLEGLSGVEKTNVNYRQNEANVVYDPEKVTVEHMIKELKRNRYIAYLKGKAIERIVVHMESLDAEKIPLLEKLIAEIHGVKAIKTSMILRKLEIYVDAGKVKRERIVRVVSGQGFKVVSR